MIARLSRLQDWLSDDDDGSDFSWHGKQPIDDIFVNRFTISDLLFF